MTHDIERIQALGALADQHVLPRHIPKPPAQLPAMPAPAPQAAPTEAISLVDTAGAAGDAWPELVPLPEDTSDTTPPAPFPFAALGPLLGAAAQAIAQDVQAPDAMAGGSVLAAASLAVQPLADVVLPHGKACPLSLYLVTSGSSGDRKSAVDDVACMEIARRKQEQSRQHHHAMQAYQQEQASHKKGDPEPQEPMMKSLTVGNATVEGVARLLRGQSSVGVFSAEGGEVLGGHSMKEVNRMGAMAFFLKGWSAETLDVMRGGTGYSSLLGRRIALHIMVQPLLLRALLSDPLADGQGFLARCLIAQPQTLAGTRFYNGHNPMESPAVLAYAHRMGQLLDTRPELWPTGDGYELKPKRLPLDPDARTLWVAFYNAVEAQQADGQELEQARAFASKAAEQAARIAAIIALFNNPQAVAVDVLAMDGAIGLVNFYLTEHVRLMGTGKQAQTDKRLRALWDWMQEQGAIVQQKDILQRCPNPIRKLKAQGIKPLLEQLGQRGYIRALGAGWEVRHVD
ncbi:MULTISPECIES: YfjI family protein [Giesbergeria]|uniref:YfjI family protein n=1 Tax=Giesbergeria sinuosa TaxID=80883 RepID=A0ABV9QDD4_9BURK